MRTISIVTLCILCAASANARKEDVCAKLDHTGTVGRSIRAHADRVRGSHRCESRKYVENDINRDGERDLLVTYTIEGACFEDRKSPPGTCGNHHEEYLAVFLKQKGKYKKPVVREVGGRNVRFIEDLSVKGSTITLDTLEYGEDDPSCCPSRPGKMKLILKKDKLMEKK